MHAPAGIAGVVCVACVAGCIGAAGVAGNVAAADIVARRRISKRQSIVAPKAQRCRCYTRCGFHSFITTLGPFWLKISAGLRLAGKCGEGGALFGYLHRQERRLFSACGARKAGARRFLAINRMPRKAGTGRWRPCRAMPLLRCRPVAAHSGLSVLLAYIFRPETDACRRSPQPAPMLRAAGALRSTRLRHGRAEALPCAGFGRWRAFRTVRLRVFWAARGSPSRPSRRNRARLRTRPRRPQRAHLRIRHPPRAHRRSRRPFPCP